MRPVFFAGMVCQTRSRTAVDAAVADAEAPHDVQIVCGDGPASSSPGDPLLGMPDLELPKASLSESARERLQAALRQAASES